MLIGDKISLNTINYSDTENIIKWRNFDFVRKNFIYQELFTVESHEKWMKSMVETGCVKQFIIVRNDTNIPIGSVYLRDIDYNGGIAEFGIFIGEINSLGKGFGQEATKLICDYGFHDLGLSVIFLRVLDENKKAIKSYLKSGFILDENRTETIEIGKSVHKVVFMKIVKSERT